jgi:hypothetical protein
LRAFAFLLEVAAAHLRRLGSVGLGARGLLAVLAEVGEDVLLAEDRGAVLEPERRDRVGARRREQRGALRAFDWDLAVDVILSELGQPLADTP